MHPTWWSAQDAEYPTLEAEHIATRGDHFGTVQTECSICKAQIERDPPIDTQTELSIPRAAHV